MGVRDFIFWILLLDGRLYVSLDSAGARVDPGVVDVGVDCSQVLRTGRPVLLALSVPLKEKHKSLLADFIRDKS